MPAKNYGYSFSNYSTSEQFDTAGQQAQSGWTSNTGFGLRDTEMSSGSSNGFNQENLNYQQILANATAFDLQRAGNRVFLELRDAKTQLEYSLNAQKELVQQLLHSRPPPVPQIAPAQSTSPSDTLNTPAPPTQEDEEDYPNVRFWTNDSWMKFVDRQKEKGLKVSAMGWLTDENDCEIDDRTLKNMTDYAYALFSKYYYLRLDPNTWKLRQPEVTTHFCNSMRTQFPILNLANDDWKVHAFARTRYPNWNRYHREPGHLKRKYPSINSSSASINRNQPLPKKLKQEVEIVISDDERVSIPSTKAARKQQLPRVKKEFAHPNPKPSVMASALPQDAIDLTITTEDPTTKSPHENPSPTAATISKPRENHIDKVGTTENVTPGPGATPSSTTMASTPPEPPKVTTTEGIPVLGTTTATTSASPPSASTQTLPAAKPGLFDGLSIPGPVERVEKVALDAPEVSKKGKPMVPLPNSVTARNLFGVDYMLKHPTTTVAEFGVIWKGLDKETRDKYNALSKEKSNEKKQKQKK